MKTPENNNLEIYEAIYEVVRSIPKGRVTCYGAIAKAIGLKSGARMVARAMSHDKNVKPPVPAQRVVRVVNSSGVLSGDNGYRKKLLEAEGVHVHNNKVADFKTVFWDPLTEISL
jgi:methylated-DNA-protein-cysteine methyltransferase related protein